MKMGVFANVNNAVVEFDVEEMNDIFDEDSVIYVEKIILNGVATINMDEEMSTEELEYIWEQLECWDDDVFLAALEYEGLFNFQYLVESNPDNWVLHRDINSDYDLGYYYANEVCGLEFSNDLLADYFNYEAYGYDVRLNTQGCFTAYGWVECIK